nr:hypothetical protein [Aspergillus terreus chrysovirus 1]
MSSARLREGQSLFRTVLSALREESEATKSKRKKVAFSTASRSTYRGSKRPDKQARARRKHLTVCYPEAVGEDFEPQESNWSSQLVALVMPSGLGKTKLADQFGWLDCDNLIDSKLRHEVEDRMYDGLIAGVSWAEAREEYIARCRDTLDLMTFSETTVLLIHDPVSASMLGVPVIGVINFLDRSSLLAIHEASEPHRKVFAEINFNIINSLPRHDVYLDVENHTESEMGAVFITAMHGFPVAVPHRYGQAGPKNGHEVGDYLSDQPHDLDRLIAAEQEGLIPRVTVNYHVRRSGLKFYKGYGVTINDWAGVFAKAAQGPGEVPQDSDDWVSLGAMDVGSLTKYLKLGGGSDMDYIISRHQNASAKFLLNLLVHWKAVGVKTSVKTSLIRLYGLPAHTWSRVHTGIRRLMIKSETYMDMFVSAEDRQVLLDLHNLRFTTGSQLANTVLDGVHDYVAAHAGVVSKDRMRRLTHRLQPVPVLTEASDDLVANLPNIKIPNGKPMLLEWLSPEAEVSLDDAVCRKQLCYLLATNLWERWDEAADAKSSRLGSIIHKIMIDWHRVAMVQDEWSRTIVQLLDEKCPALAGNLAFILCCDFEQACKGEDWSVRLFRAMQRLTVGMLCAEKLDTSIQATASELVLSGVGETQQLTTLADINVPRHMLTGLGERTATLVNVVTKLRNLERSSTMCLLNVLHLEGLLPIQCSLKTKLAAMAYANDRYTPKLGPDVVRACLGVYYKLWVGEHLSRRRLTELTNYIYSDQGGVADRDGHIRKFRRPFREQKESSGLAYQNGQYHENLRTLGDVKQWKSLLVLQSDADNPETVVKNKRKAPVGDTTEALGRLLSMNKVGCRRARHSMRRASEVSDHEVYGLVPPMLAALVDDLSSNPKIRSNTASGLWKVLPSPLQDIEVMNFQMRLAINELADMTI